MSMFSKLVLAATTNAMRSAGIEDVQSFSQTCGSVLGSSHGSSEYAEKYYTQVVEEGIAAANPVMFAEGVPNVGTAHLSLMLGLQGSAQTIIGSRTSGLDAISLAALRIRNGEWDRAIVGGADELSPTAERLYGHTERGSSPVPVASCSCSSPRTPLVSVGPGCWLAWVPPPSATIRTTPPRITRSSSSVDRSTFRSESSLLWRSARGVGGRSTGSEPRMT